MHEPVQAAKRGLRDLARRIVALDAEIAAADQELARLTQKAVPSLLAMRQVGTQTAAQLVITAGQNITRMRTEATFAKLCGVAPLPASSGVGVRPHVSVGVRPDVSVPAWGSWHWFTSGDEGEAVFESVGRAVDG